MKKILLSLLLYLTVTSQVLACFQSRGTIERALQGAIANISRNISNQETIPIQVIGQEFVCPAIFTPLRDLISSVSTQPNLPFNFHESLTETPYNLRVQTGPLGNEAADSIRLTLTLYHSNETQSDLLIGTDNFSLQISQSCFNTCQQQLSCPREKGKSYLIIPNQVSYAEISTTIRHLNDNSRCQSNQWQLPSRQEIHHWLGNSNKTPVLPNCPECQDKLFWTNDSAGGDDNKWGVNLHYGNAQVVSASSQHNLLLIKHP